MAVSHSEGDRKKQFCTQRKPTCTCAQKNKFRSNCVPTPGKWKVKGVKKDYEAHHLLCVATITAYLLREAKIIKVVNQVVWCINNKKNMYPMPLWGQHVAWYSDYKNYTKSGSPKKPAFAEFAAHNRDHNGGGSYKKNLDIWTAKVAMQVENSTEAHTTVASKLATKLDKKSDDCRTFLVDRGKDPVPGTTESGTHGGWLAGMKTSTSQWYVPFSMAVTPKPRTFPLTQGKIDNLKKRAKLYGGP